MKKYIFIFLYMTFFSCKNDEPIRYIQFSKDDLSHLYYDKDTLTFTGNDIVYKDTIAYLLNDTDSIYVPIETQIYSSHNAKRIVKIEDLYGKSLMIFDKKMGFDTVSVSISKTENYGNAAKFFHVNSNGINPFTEQYSQTESVLVDTALVLEKVYQNVYKFYPLERYKTSIRSIYFAKKYGYIKIEKSDGVKLERINKANSSHYLLDK